MKCYCLVFVTIDCSHISKHVEDACTHTYSQKLRVIGLTLGQQQ